MKYGNIICDPASEEAKALIGKKIIYAYNYHRLDNLKLANIGVLYSVDETAEEPFKVMVGNTIHHTMFIREVIEEKPTYHPYKDTDEMIEDFKKRFCNHTTIPQYAMPLIWVLNEYGTRLMVTSFDTSSIYIGFCNHDFNEVLNDYTYLDGTPVGKEVTQ